MVAVSVKPKQSGTKLQLSGKAGSYKNNISLTVSPGPTNSYTSNKLSASIIILSTWNWFDSTSAYNTLSTTAAANYPTFANNHQKPLSLQIGKDQYLTYIPFLRGVVPLPLSFSVYFDNVKLPYTHDLPYYSILLID